jgi:hypothetical protein
MLLPITDSLVVQTDDALRLLRFQWAASSRQAVRPAFARGRDLVIEYQPTRTLVDFSGLPPIGMADEIWLARNWLPIILKQSLQHVALVFRAHHHLHNQLVFEALFWAGRRHIGFEFQLFDDSTAALHWLTGSDCAVQSLQAEWLAAAPVARP